MVLFPKLNRKSRKAENKINRKIKKQRQQSKQRKLFNFSRIMLFRILKTLTSEEKLLSIAMPFILQFKNNQECILNSNSFKIVKNRNNCEGKKETKKKKTHKRN